MTSRKLLIVDDHEELAESLATVLSLHDYSADIVSTALAACEAVRERHYDLVLLDYALPDASGAEVLAQLRELKPTLSVFLMSGYSNHELYQREPRLMHETVLTKPMDPEQVLQLLEIVNECSVR
jgi:two-component system response regulator HydG